MKQIIVQSLISSTQTAVMQDNKLIELLIEDNIHKKTKSNIYRGIVKNIKPGIEAAFVDIGFEKMAYLPIKSSDDIKMVWKFSFKSTKKLLELRHQDLHKR